MTSTLNNNGKYLQLDDSDSYDLAHIVRFTPDKDTDDNSLGDEGAINQPDYIYTSSIANNNDSHPDGDNPITANTPQLEADGEDTGAIHISSDYINDEDEDGADEGSSDPYHNKTQVTLINSPFSQIALVAGGVLVVILSVGGVLTMLTAERTEPPTIAQSPPSATENVETNTNKDNLDETSKYKTEAAMGQQRELLRGKPGQSPAKVSPTPTLPKSAQPLSPVAVAALPPVPLPVIPPVLPATPTTQPTLEDSVRTWQLLATVGSYGQIPGSSSSSNTTARNAIAPSTSPLFSPSTVSHTAVTPVVTTSHSSGVSIQQLRAASSVPGMRDRPLVPVLVGTNTRGQLGTAIVLSSDNSSPVDPTNPRATKYLIQLTDSLKDATGAIAIPAGAMVVATVRTFAPTTGKAELQAIAAIVNNREYKLPDGAIIVRATDGGTLALKQQGSNSNKFFQATLPALMSGASQVGQAINQPTSASTVSAGSVTTSVSNSKNPNLLASFTSGAANTLSQQLTQQIQVANQATSQQQKAWAIGAGTQVQVFVNSTFEM